MESLVFTPTYELFLVLEPVRDCLVQVLPALEPLDGDEGPELIGVDVFYRQATDVALLALRFDERTLTYAGLTWVLDLAAGAGLPALDPARLGDRDRRSFYEGYLASYELRLEDRGAAHEALVELGRRLDLLSGVVEPPTARRARTVTGWGAALPPPPVRPPRLPTAPIVEPLAPADAPEATPREGNPAQGGAQARMRRLGSSPPTASVPPNRGPLGKLSPRHDSPTKRQQLSLAEQAALARSRAPQRAPTAPEEPDTEVEGVSAPRGKNKQRSRKTTMPATPVAKRATTSPPGVPSPAGNETTERVRSPDAAVALDVQFLRGSQWVPARLRSLSSRGAYLVTGAPPRVGDSVHIAIDFRDHSAMVHGTIHHVTTAEDALSTGSSGFAVRFPETDSPARRQLIELLKAARGAGVTIKPPPSRRAVRFPVRWPVRVDGGRGDFGAAALDLSTGGLFVATPRELAEDVVFRLPLDNGDEMVSGRARVARTVDDRMASARGLSRGYGLSITALAEGDVRRYESFLDRVRRRCDKRVVVGADPDRARALVSSLTAAGYSVTASSDAGVLVRLADLEPRAPDAAILDASLVSPVARLSLLEQAFAARRVPCLSTSDEPPDRARSCVDRLLAVGI